MSYAWRFIHRPVGTTLIMIGVLLLGALSYVLLPVASLPSVDRPTIVVVAPLPGAGPTTVASALSQPLETQLGRIAGLSEMGSFSGTGGTQITLQFDLSMDIDTAAGDVQAAINRAGPYLPKNWAWPPYYYKANPAGFSVIMLALTSDTIASPDMYDLADTVLAPKLSQVPGVARVLIAGADRAAVRVQIDPKRLAVMNIPLEQVRAALSVGSSNLPKGQVSGDGLRMEIAANDQLIKAADYRELPVGTVGGVPVLLGDVATVEDGVMNRKLAGWFNGKPSALVFVYKQPQANVVATVDAVKEVLPQLQSWLPHGINMDVVFDRTTLIRSAIGDVQWTIAFAIGLVVIVLAIFLRRLAATLLPVVAIPVALAATLCMMIAAEYTLDNLTLMALTIAIGFVVDDTVIIVEEIVRRLDAGDSPSMAAASGAQHLGATIASITAVLAAALIPIVFMPDVVGRYLREFGLTLIAAIVASAAVSLLFTPVMAAHLFRSRGKAVKAGLPLNWYVRSLGWVLRRRSIAVAMVAVTALGSAWLYQTLPKGFMPTQDTGVALVHTVALANISFDEMQNLQRQVNAVVQADPDVGSLVSFIGEGDGGSLSVGTMLVAVRTTRGRSPPLEAVIARLRDRLRSIHGIRAFFTPVQDLNLGVQASAARYQYTLWGADQEQVEAAGVKLMAAMRRMPGLIDVIGNWESSGLDLGLVIDRDRAAAMGVTPVAIDNTLYDAFGQRQLGTIYLRSNYTRVILETDPSRAGAAQLQDIYVPGSYGQVPLLSLMRETRSHAPAWIRHSAQFPSVTVSFDTAAGTSLGQAIAEIEQGNASLAVPPTVHAEFRGEAGEAVKGNARQIALWIAALIGIYIVLGILYESFLHPLSVLSTLPLGLIGGLLALWLTGAVFTTITFIASILLLGMVMRNAILMVDQALDAERRLGFDATEAIIMAASTRFRPILMTTLAAGVSTLPIVFDHGPGHELRQPLGILIVGGLASAQLLTLYLTPAIYLSIDSMRSKRHRAAFPTAWTF